MESIIWRRSYRNFLYLHAMKLPVVCIIGRPNVGKSSLFNRILGRRAAVVSDRDGVTRDRHYQTANYKGHEFTVVDTGGFLPDDSIDVLADSVRAQIFNAVEESDLVLFMVDVRVGITKLDEQFARMVRKLDKKVILVANKSEQQGDRQESYEFLKLGFGQPRTISALTGYACLRSWTRSSRFSRRRCVANARKNAPSVSRFSAARTQARARC